MATLIDTSVLVAAERGILSLELFLGRYAEEQFAISAVTAAELLHGVHRATDSARRRQRSAFVEAMLNRLPVVAFDLTVARVHASVWAVLAKKGVSIGERDLMIAATAIAHGSALATCDARSFPKIPGLTVRRV